MATVAELLKPYRHLSNLDNRPEWQQVREQLDQLVFDYFGLSVTERKVVSETCEYFIPSRQPNRLAALKQPLFHAPGGLKAYNKLLKQSHLVLASSRRR